MADHAGRRADSDRPGVGGAATPSGAETGEWERLIARDASHSQWFIDRFRRLAAEGNDIVGEARLVDAMVGRRARVLDAGCGGGRIGGHLHDAGHDVVGVDIDPALIAAAEEDYPGPTWRVADLAELDLEEGFDVVVCAGNVMTFVAPSTRAEVVRRMGLSLRAGGRLAVGFGAGRGYALDEFVGDVERAGLVPELMLESWDLRPYRPGESNFLVAVLARR